ncbi:hypothetical protein C7974DRAFT_374063 [Boeremia exigua]|uniref:uncharacterized protein n=1 Tax=Boeremia exigua TaxID=749465 RepID=UPI001E8E0580|nr:uncharacterized protein C7974DRAFT_374063 [Boeremia exigua]KAH6639896.1 hypothetical protein C7974DRAFT_374063 [Boeremia exigua]
MQASPRSASSSISQAWAKQYAPWALAIIFFVCLVLMSISGWGFKGTLSDDLYFFKVKFTELDMMASDLPNDDLTAALKYSAESSKLARVYEVHLYNFCQRNHAERVVTYCPPRISSVSTVAAVLISTATFSAFVRAMNEILQHYRVYLTVGTHELVIAWLAVLCGWASTSFWLFSACSCPSRNDPHHRSNKGGLWSSPPSNYGRRSRVLVEKTGGLYEGVLNPFLAEDKDPLVTEYKGPASGKFEPYMHRNSE